MSIINKENKNGDKNEINYIIENKFITNAKTEEELIELSPFMREDEYNDTNFVLTGYESEEEQISVKRSLLEEAKKELKKIQKDY